VVHFYQPHFPFTLTILLVFRVLSYSLDYEYLYSPGKSGSNEKEKKKTNKQT